MNELKHHGILGMKWGERRFQNKDGSLTEKGRARYNKVASSEKLQAKESKKAKRILKDAVKKADLCRRVNEKKAKKQRMKENHYAANKYDKTAKSLDTLSRLYKQKMSDIDSGKMKAGRDFIVQTDYYVTPLVFYNSVTKSQKIIEQKKRIY